MDSLEQRNENQKHLKIYENCIQELLSYLGILWPN